MAGRGDVADELLARAAGTTVPMVRAQRHRLNGTAQGSATGDPETDALIGITATPEVSGAVAEALNKYAPRYAAFRTNVEDMKPDDLAQADQIYRQGDLSDAIIRGTADRNRVAGAQAAAKGNDLFSSDSTGAVLDKFQGSLDTSNPMAGSTINLRKEQAGAQRANAAQSYAQGRAADALADQRKQVTAAGPGGGVGGKAPAGYRWTAGQDGELRLEPIPGGPKDPANNLGGSGKPMTEGQAKANLFGNRMVEADAVLREQEEKGVYRPGNMKAMVEGVAGAVPLVGDSLREGASAAMNWTQSAGQQQVDQARRDFINAVLRRESGAVISDSEFANADKQYFPQLGDSKEVREQKRRNRERVTQLMLDEVPEHHRKKPAPRGASGSWDETPSQPANRNVKVDW